MNQEQSLNGKRIAILATDGFEQSELEKPRRALEDAGAIAQIVSPADESITGWAEGDFGDSVPVDVNLRDADPADYDGLLLPGGVMNPDKLRTVPSAVAFVREFFDTGKPVAAICHGPQILIDADVLKGRTVTSYASIKTDLINAGASWVDQPVVTDNGLVTSRKPADIPEFNRKMIEEFAEGIHTGQKPATGHR
ncbi:MAG TPA: type 1 glutamine amidotransferase domain-containing protein [Opitutaceae bacterium]|nr:type 1 glutamine amidotransferase domain-containing protein [Opitutaceae bacterium]